MTAGSPTPPTPSQTIGPFFWLGCNWLDNAELVAEAQPNAVVLRGQVLDGAGHPVPDALVEIWQADEHGAFPTTERVGAGGASGSDGSVPARSWTGFGRALTDPEGRYRFVTIVPGAVETGHAPHIDVTVFARGLTQRVVTRVYPPDDGAAHETDPVLTTVDPDRRATLLAARDGNELRFDIHLQGDHETVFFAW
jgi:protocatechuate 3,4-dioxygenase alpha subunit